MKNSIKLALLLTLSFLFPLISKGQKPKLNKDALYVAQQLGWLEKYIKVSNLNSDTSFAQCFKDLGYNNYKISQSIFKFINKEDIELEEINKNITRANIESLTYVFADLKDSIQQDKIKVRSKLAIEDYKKQKTSFEEIYKTIGQLPEDSIKSNEKRQSMIKEKFNEITTYKLPRIDSTVIKNSLDSLIKDLEMKLRKAEKTKKENEVLFNRIDSAGKIIGPPVKAGNLTTPIFELAKSTEISHVNEERQKIGLPSTIPTESEVIDAVAVLIANRLKEEVTLTFFEHFRKNIENDKLLRYLFPNTLGILTSTESFIKPSLGSSWKHAFAIDFIKIPEKLATIPDHIFYNNEEKLQAITASYNLTQGLRKGRDFKDEIDNLSVQHSFNENNNLSRLIALIKAFNDNIIDYSDSANYFVTYANFQKMTKSEKYYFFRLFGSYNNELFSSLLNDTTKSNCKTENALKNYYDRDQEKVRLSFLAIIQAYNRFTLIQEKLNINNGNGIDQLALYWESLSDLIKELVAFLPEDTKRKLQPIVKINDLLIDTEKAVETRNYGLVAMNSGLILKELVTKESGNISPKMIPSADNYYFNKAMHHMSRLKNKTGPDSVIKSYYVRSRIRLDLIERSLSKSYRIGGSENDNEVEKYLDNHYILAAKSIYNKVEKSDEQVFKILKVQEINSRLDKIIKNSDNNKSTRKICKKSKKKLGKTEKYKNTDTIKINNDFHKVLAEEAIDNFLNITSLIADILSAKSSQDLTKAIQNKAAPVSSYKIKRNSTFSIDLNAYPGLYSGQEWRYQRPADYTFNLDKPGIVSGFTTPIGIALSWGWRYRVKQAYLIKKHQTFQNNKGKLKNLTGNSISIILTGIDIGAVVSYRLFNSDTTALPQEVNLKQIFAPGFYIGQGIKNTPLVFLIGVQYNPRLRSFTSEEGPFNTVKISGTIAFDIPLYNAMNRRKRHRFHHTL